MNNYPTVDKVVYYISIVIMAILIIMTPFICIKLFFIWPAENALCATIGLMLLNIVQCAFLYDTVKSHNRNDEW